MSILITAGIIEAVPTAIVQTGSLIRFGQLAYWKLALMAVLFVFTVVTVILIIQGQRKIPVQYAKQIRGHRVYGGQSTYLPLKVNQAGVIPIIFAQSVILFPATIAGFFPAGPVRAMATWLTPGGALYISMEAFLIIFF